MRILFLIGFFLFTLTGKAQETNAGKRLYAKSYLNQKAPELIVQEWLTEKPDTRGKFVLIDYSATWCHACRKSMPELNDYQKKFADKLVVIFLTKESVQKVHDAKNFRCELSMAIDTFNRSTTALQVKGIPHNILIDPKGYVRWEGFPATRDFELTEEVLVSLFKKYSPAPADIYNIPRVRKVLPELPSFKGPVKKYTETDFASLGSEEEIKKGSMLTKRIAAYDMDGNVTEEKLYKKGDTLVNLTRATYDNSGNVMKRVCFDSSGNVFTTINYSYNKGRLTGEVIKDKKGKTDCKSFYVYDNAGNLIEERLLSGDDHLVYKTVYKYIKNKLTEKTIYNGLNEVASRFIAQYNESGQPVETTVSGPKNMLHRYTYSYDNTHNLVEEKVFTPDNQLSSVYAYAYEDGDRTEETVTYPDGKQIIRYAFKYDDHHNQTETYRFDYDEIYLQSKYAHNPNSEMVIWDYWNQGKPSTKYNNSYENMDKYGNWLKRTKVANGRPMGYTEREIQYQVGVAKNRQIIH